jgi:hypothetical protein
VRAPALRRTGYHSACELFAKQKASLLNGPIPLLLGDIMPSERMALKLLN